MTNWKEQLQPYLDKHRLGVSGSTNDLLDSIQVEIIEKLIEEIPDTVVGTKTAEIPLAPTYASTEHLKQQLRDKWL
jgi:hypothetical protein